MDFKKKERGIVIGNGNGEEKKDNRQRDLAAKDAFASGGCLYHSTFPRGWGPRASVRVDRIPLSPLISPRTRRSGRRETHRGADVLRVSGEVILLALGRERGYGIPIQ